MYHKKTVAKVTRMNYAGLVNSLNVDTIISPKSAIAAQIIRYVRAKVNKDDDSSVKTLYKIIKQTKVRNELLIIPMNMQ